MRNISPSKAFDTDWEFSLIPIKHSWYTKFQSICTRITQPPLIGGIMANSSLSLTMVDSGVYSSFRARTMHPWISSRPGNLATSLFQQSLALLPDETSNGNSVKPVRSLARAKNKTFIWTEVFSFPIVSAFAVSFSLSMASTAEYPAHQLRWKW